MGILELGITNSRCAAGKGLEQVGRLTDMNCRDESLNAGHTTRLFNREGKVLKKGQVQLDRMGLSNQLIS